jgi:hypothetical protein
MLNKPTRKQQRWAFEYFVADAKEQKPNSTTEEIAKAWMDLTPFDRIKYLAAAVCDRDRHSHLLRLRASVDFF